MLKLTIPSHLSSGLFFRISLILDVFSLLMPPPKNETPLLTPASHLEAVASHRDELSTNEFGIEAQLL
ncbi:hypothetical protein Tco_0695332 [Tanacetum coccineum]